MQRTITLLLYLLIAIGAFGGLFAANSRYTAEKSNRRVELALEYSEVKQLAVAAHQSVESTLKALKQTGITSLAIPEDSIAGLDALGELHPERVDSITNVAVTSSATLERIEHALTSKGIVSVWNTPSKEVSLKSLTTFQIGQNYETGFHIRRSVELGNPHAAELLSVPFNDYATLRGISVGLDPDALKSAKEADLQPIARIANFAGASPTTMINVLSDLKSAGVHTVVFSGTDVLGYPTQYKEAAEALQIVGLIYGQVEFGKQRGDESLATILKGEYVRVHSISDAELESVSPDKTELIDRFVLAARERNIRLCYIHLLTVSGVDPLGYNVDFIHQIVEGIARGNEMEFGTATPFQETHIPLWDFALMAVGAAAGTILLIIRLVPVPNRVAFMCLVALLLICVGATLGLGETGRKLVALLAALVFPSLACLRRDILTANPTEFTNTMKQEMGPSSAAYRALIGLMTASSITFIGIVYVVGLLATRPFMLRANQFMGVKAAHAIPFALIGVLAIFGMPCLNSSLSNEWDKLKERASRIFSEQIRIGPLLLAILVIAGIGLLLARTGNEPGVGVSGVELKFRSVLNKTLPVRPRTKEFLIGHPAFLLGLALWFRGRRRWAKPLYVLGVIGQASMLNTFCHIHSPLRLSLIRDVLGLALGAVVGLILFFLIEHIVGMVKAKTVSDTAVRMSSV